jgi:hypothetical protein
MSASPFIAGFVLVAGLVAWLLIVRRTLAEDRERYAKGELPLYAAPRWTLSGYESGGPDDLGMSDMQARSDGDRTKPDVANEIQPSDPAYYGAVI